MILKGKYMKNHFFFQPCVYCKQKGATVGCCRKQCRRSFHFHCGKKNDYSFTFVKFKSYCNQHCPPTVHRDQHDDSTICELCSVTMGPYSLVNSIKLICCDSRSWFHRFCLQKNAFEFGVDFKCPKCSESDDFRTYMLQCGIFVTGDLNITSFKFIIQFLACIMRSRTKSVFFGLRSPIIMTIPEYNWLSNIVTKLKSW